MFALHPQLAAETRIVGRFPLCLLLLMNNATIPWFLLVPQREGMREIHELSETDQQQLIRESSWLARALADQFRADKMNVAALGNVVPQLHVHHVVRYKTDPAWPEPVWGRVAARPYAPAEKERVLSALRNGLPNSFEWIS